MVLYPRAGRLYNKNPSAQGEQLRCNKSRHQERSTESRWCWSARQFLQACTNSTAHTSPITPPRGSGFLLERRPLPRGQEVDANRTIPSRGFAGGKASAGFARRTVNRARVLVSRALSPWPPLDPKAPSNFFNLVCRFQYDA